MRFPTDMDVECIDICTALNELPGIETVESCCGHGKRPFRIFFRASALESLHPVLRCVASSAWSVEAFWSNGQPTAMIMLKGPVGTPDMPGNANHLAGWLRQDHARILSPGEPDEAALELQPYRYSYSQSKMHPPFWIVKDGSRHLAEVWNEDDAKRLVAALAFTTEALAPTMSHI